MGDEVDGERIWKGLEKMIAIWDLKIWVSNVFGGLSGIFPELHKACEIPFQMNKTFCYYKI